jgi:hypothetical protein
MRFPRGSAYHATTGCAVPGRRVSRNAPGIAPIHIRYYPCRMETVSFKLPPGLRARLEQEAKRRQVGRSTIIRESLERTLGRTRAPRRELTCADIAGDLVGVIDGPRDLSVNASYLKRALTRRRARRSGRNR